MITDQDIQKMKKVFASKGEIGSIIDMKLKPVHKKIDKIQKTLDTTITYFDTITTKHDRRLKRVESHLNLSIIAD